MGKDDDTFALVSNKRIAHFERVQKFRMFFAGLIFAIISFIGVLTKFMALLFV